MIKAASKKGWIDPDKTARKVLPSIKCAGADLILTYFTEDIARELY